MSTSQESLPPQNETTSKSESDDDKTLKQDYDPHLQEKPPSENEATSKSKFDNAKTLKQDSNLHLQEKPSSENETTSKPESDNAKILKRDSDLHLQEKTPSENEITSKQKSDNAKTLKQDFDLHLQEKPPSENETTSKPEFDSAKTLKQDFDPYLQEKTPFENETTSKPKSDDVENLKQDFDPYLQEKPSSENETTSKPESVDAKTSKQDSEAHLQEKLPSTNDTTLKPKSDNAKTLKHDHDLHLQQKIETTSEGKHDLAADAQTRVQEITSAENETASKNSSPPKNTAPNEKEMDDNKSLKEKPAKDTKKSWLYQVLRNLITRPSKKLSPESSVGRQVPEHRTPESSVERQAPEHPTEMEVLSSLIRADLEYIGKVAENIDKYNNQLNSVLKQASEDFEKLKERETKEGFEELRKEMTKLRLQIPSKLQIDKDEKEPYKNLQLKSKAKEIPADGAEIMPQLYENDVFENSIEFKDFEARYNKLPPKQKLCLLCFSIFPEKATIKKRLMLHWWTAEGFVGEDDANDLFKELIREGFIEPVNDNKSCDIGRCQIHPFYRSVLVTLAARAKFFNFVRNGAPTQNFNNCFQACLVGEGLISYDDLVRKSVTVDDLEKIHLLINVNEPILEFNDWFSKMTNVNILYLGRWREEDRDHVEVEDTIFLEGLENMQYMKFFSLQGVSNVISLPKSILQLTNLKILNLRACQNLEAIPEGIGLVLKSLTHLDMSECYLLNHMPKSLSLLKRLKVLEGFFVGSEKEKSGKEKSSCTLHDLKNLENLIKLCIYTSLKKFPEEKHVKALGNLRKLKKLTIAWGGKNLLEGSADVPKTSDGDKKHGEKENKGTSEVSNGSDSTPKLPPTLEKLDLKCFPTSKTPNWLALRNLKDLQYLEKLYIRGGKFSDLGQYQDTDDWKVNKYTWKVKVLRLKYLSEIKMDWRQLQELFPDLVYLEQVSCPKLTLVPCDAKGVWIKETKR